jgi:glucose-6-phosphate 1-dehydrogenase
MDAVNKVGPTVIVIFGATGDLTWRKLIPAIYNLYLDKWIPEHFSMIGIGHKDQTEAAFRKHLQEGVDTFSRKGKSDKKQWDAFTKCLTYCQGEFGDKSTYTNVDKQIKALEKEWKVEVNRIFYMAVTPSR